MKYFKNIQNNLYALDDKADAATLEKIIAEHGLAEITADEYAAMIAPTIDDLAADVRAKRDGLLREFDAKIYCNSLRWAEYTTDEQTAWIAYRQALKDIPEQATFPQSVVWPTKP